MGKKEDIKKLDKAFNILKWINIIVLIICLVFINIWQLAGWFTNPMDGILLALFSGFLFYLYNFWILYIPLIILKIIIISKRGYSK